MKKMTIFIMACTIVFFVMPDIKCLAAELQLDDTHDPMLVCWVESANGPNTEFPIQNLPYGVFRPLDRASKTPRIGVAIGDFVLDLKGCVDAHYLDTISPEAREALSETTLNRLMSLDRSQWIAIRKAISKLLRPDTTTMKMEGNRTKIEKILFNQSKVEMLMPVDIREYTDFYGSIHHAARIGSLFRPENPLTPNYKHMPIGYHGRASSVVVSGTSIQRPGGQIKTQDTQPPFLGPSQKLDFEVELGLFIGKGNALTKPVGINEAEDYMFGFVILNDWSARDIQKWEYQPLGPFIGKNFATSISPWIVTYEALKPFLIPQQPRKNEDPPLLDYLNPQKPQTIDVNFEAFLSPAELNDSNHPPLLIARTHFSDMYWTFQQMLAHHTVGGCNLRPGDLIGSGTTSGPTHDSIGCLLERAAVTAEPMALPYNLKRTFLEDGDEVIIKAYAIKEGYPRIGFGECRGAIKAKKKD